jgi:hypothetical protein
MTDMLLIAGWCFAASLFTPLFAWALMPFLARCAATRHLVWLALFAVLLVLPLLALTVPPQLVLHQAVEGAASAPSANPAPRGWSLTDAIPLLILTWLLGIGFNLARLALGLLGLRRLRRHSVPFAGMRDVRLADDGPLAFGVIHPLILLPHDAAHWPQSRLDAVLAHEHAHLGRRDSFTQMFAQCVCAFYWPNPLLWLAARSMRREAEIAADNAVLMGGMRASDYAAELLQFAGQNLRLPAVAMAAPSLEARVKSVLSPAPSRNGVRAMDAFKIIWLGSAAAVALAFVRPAIAQVQNDPPAPAAPQVPAAPPQAKPIPDAPSVPDAPPAQARKAMRHHHRVAVTIDDTVGGGKLTEADKARIDTAVAQAKASMATIGPEIERAIQQAHIDEAAARSVQQATPKVRAAIAQAMAQIQPAIRQALADAKVDAQVSVALNKAQVDIDAAVADAARHGPHPHISVHVKVPPHQPVPPDPPDPGSDGGNP